MIIIYIRGGGITKGVFISTTGWRPKRVILFVGGIGQLGEVRGAAGWGRGMRGWRRGLAVGRGGGRVGGVGEGGVTKGLLINYFGSGSEEGDHYLPWRGGGAVLSKCSLITVGLGVERVIIIYFGGGVGGITKGVFIYYSRDGDTRE